MPYRAGSDIYGLPLLPLTTLVRHGRCRVLKTILDTKCASQVPSLPRLQILSAYCGNAHYSCTNQISNLPRLQRVDQGMEVAFGTGVTSLVTLCGALSTACGNLQEQGVPTNAVLHGLRVAEDICVAVFRGLSVPTVDIGQICGAADVHRLCQESREYFHKSWDCGETGQQHGREVSWPIGDAFSLAFLAAGLQHCASCNDVTATGDNQVRQFLVKTNYCVLFPFC